MIIGTGLIGGSVGMALRAGGWHVSGTDTAPGTAARAVELGALDVEGEDRSGRPRRGGHPGPRGRRGHRRGAGRTAWNPEAVVTDVGSVKGPLLAAVDRPRFVGGHPMAGSEQVGVEGASAELFVGATWVLTPTPSTDPAAYAQVRAVLAEFGANVIALDPAEHDSLVAVVSHVPHLTAATLMALASDLGEEHGALLQLAAGGFRDMTRIAAGQPTIWPDICDDNATAIVETLDLLIDALGAMRRRVAERDHDSLLAVLDRAATARRAMSERAPDRRSSPRSGSRSSTGPVPSPRSPCWPPSSGSTSTTSRSPTRWRGTAASSSLVVDAPSAPPFAEALGRGAPLQHVARRDGPMTDAEPGTRSVTGGTRSRAPRRSRATSRSPTGRCSWPPWPRGPRPSPASPTGTTWSGPGGPSRPWARWSSGTGGRHGHGQRGRPA